MATRLYPARHTTLVTFAFPGASRTGIIVSTFSGKDYVRIVPTRQGMVNFSAHGDKKMPSGFHGCFIVRFSRSFSTFIDIGSNRLVSTGRRGKGRINTVVAFGADRHNRGVRTHMTSSFVDDTRTVRGLGRLKRTSVSRLGRRNHRH